MNTSQRLSDALIQLLRRLQALCTAWLQFLVDAVLRHRYTLQQALCQRRVCSGCYNSLIGARIFSVGRPELTTFNHVMTWQSQLRSGIKMPGVDCS
jgi:hypothetical protein